jgi:hypothetical protein
MGRHNLDDVTSRLVQTDLHDTSMPVFWGENVSDTELLVEELSWENQILGVQLRGLLEAAPHIAFTDPVLAQSAWRLSPRESERRTSRRRIDWMRRKKAIRSSVGVADSPVAATAANISDIARTSEDGPAAMQENGALAVDEQIITGSIKTFFTPGIIAIGTSVLGVIVFEHVRNLVRVACTEPWRLLGWEDWHSTNEEVVKTCIMVVTILFAPVCLVWLHERYGTDKPRPRFFDSDLKACSVPVVAVLDARCGRVPGGNAHSQARHRIKRWHKTAGCQGIDEAVQSGLPVRAVSPLL